MPNMYDLACVFTWSITVSAWLVGSRPRDPMCALTWSLLSPCLVLNFFGKSIL